MHYALYICWIQIHVASGAKSWVNCLVHGDRALNPVYNLQGCVAPHEDTQLEALKPRLRKADNNVDGILSFVSTMSSDDPAAMSIATKMSQYRQLLTLE